MFYKAVSAVVETKDLDIPEDIPFLLISGIIILMPFMLIALLPAILIAEDRNGIHSILCPEVISSNKLAVYCTVWGIPMILFLIYYLANRYIWESDALGLAFCNLITLYTIWLSLTQLSIHIEGTFRTDIGLLLCWPGTIAAYALLGLSSVLLIFLFMFDIAAIYKPSILDD